MRWRYKNYCSGLNLKDQFIVFSFGTVERHWDIPAMSKYHSPSFYLSLSLVTARKHPANELPYSLIKPWQIERVGAQVHWTAVKRSLSSLQIYWWLNFYWSFCVVFRNTRCCISIGFLHKGLVIMIVFILVPSNICFSVMGIVIYSSFFC